MVQITLGAAIAESEVMEDKSNAPAVWSLKDTVAHLETGQLAGSVDVARPERGLHTTALDRDSNSCRLFCTQRLGESAGRPHESSSLWPLAVAETYVRGSDLVASYQSAEAWPYSPQLYWQAGTLEAIDGALASLSLLVSVQTHLLDTHPKIHVTSQVPSGDLLLVSIAENGAASVEPVTQEGITPPNASICCALWRLQGGTLSYAEVVSAQDVQQIEFQLGPQRVLAARWHLFAEFLEKGVIRRARVHAALLPRTHDTELAIECCEATSKCPLPLTT